LKSLKAPTAPKSPAAPKSPGSPKAPKFVGKMFGPSDVMKQQPLGKDLLKKGLK
jgi:hypothetical protein